MPGVSSHFEHTLGRSVMGQQGLYKEFQEGRSIVGKRYLQAQQLTKPQTLPAMESECEGW